MITRFIFTVALTIWSGLLWASSISTISRHNTQKLIHLFHPKLGIIIANQKGHIIFERNKNEYYTSASLMKLFTATAATLILTPQYQYRTGLYVSGTVQNNTLYGNVYLHFSGDPTLKLQDISNLVHQLKEDGVHNIAGSVFLDNQSFDQRPYPPGTTVDDLAYSYASPLNAIILDENAFKLQIIPTKLKQPPILKPSISSNLISFSNHIITTDKNQPDCPLYITNNDDNHYTLNGCINLHTGIDTEDLAISNITKLTKIALQNLISQAGIKLFTPVQLGKMPHNVTLIANHYSPPLIKIVHFMLKESDNLIANCLTKTISHYSTGYPGNLSTGIGVIKKRLASLVGASLKYAHIKDGAGLSRYNLVTPQQVLNLLVSIKQSPELNSTLITALPIAGKDGTLQYRMNILKKRQRLHAKTGTLTGVSNIAGYLNSKHHGHLIVILMINQFPNKVKPIQHWENKFLTQLALY